MKDPHPRPSFQQGSGSNPDANTFSQTRLEHPDAPPTETLLSSSPSRYVSVNGQDLKSRRGLTGQRLETMHNTPMVSTLQSPLYARGDSILLNPTAYSISSDHPTYAGNLSSAFLQKKSSKVWQDRLYLEWQRVKLQLDPFLKHTWFIGCVTVFMVLATCSLCWFMFSGSQVEMMDSLLNQDPLVSSYYQDTTDKQDVPPYYASSYQVESFDDLPVSSTESPISPLVTVPDRYILYNPHNEFEFQIQSFENAVMLGSLMNCTVVAPYLKFELKSIPSTKTLWKPFEDLHKESRVWERNCTLNTSKKANCVKMEDIFDFSWMKQLSQPISIIDMDTFMQRIRVKGYTNEHVTTGDIWNQVAENTHLVLVEDVHRLSYRFYDSKTEKPNPQLDHLKEDEHFDLIDIQAFQSNETLHQFIKQHSHTLRHSKLIYQQGKYRESVQPEALVFHFGSLYGRSKLHLSNEKVHARESLHALMMGSNRQLHHMSDKITDFMGGMGSFVSVHLDLGTEFVSHIRLSVERTLECLKDVKCVLPDHFSLRPLRTEKMHSRVLECLDHHKQPYPIFLSVDLHGDPRNYPYLRPLLNEFPCIFSIHDFRNEFVGSLTIPSHVKEPVSLQHFMPIVSELVNSNGHHLNRLYEMSTQMEALHSRFESAGKKMESFRRKWIQEHVPPQQQAIKEHDMTPTPRSVSPFERLEEHHRCYVHYASHSGFNIQRTALENGVALAYSLNCSLVVPFAQVGKTLTWNDFDVLVKEAHDIERTCTYSSVEELGREHQICSSFASLFDLKAISKEFPTVRLLSTKEFSEEIDSKLNQPHDAYWNEIQEKNNIVMIKSQHKNSFLLYDSVTFNSNAKTSQFAYAQNQRHVLALDKKKEIFDVLDIHDLLTPEAMELRYKREGLKNTVVEYHPLKRNLPPFSTIYRFGSLDGEKVVLSMFQRAIKDHLHSAMIFRNPVLLSIARDVIAKLGGAGSYVSLHLRTQDEFAKDIHQTVRLMIQTLRACTNHQECDVKKEGELGFISDPNVDISKTLLNEKSARLCSRINKETGSTDKFTIFLATDMKLSEMKQNPMVAAFLREYPCVYTLTHFSQEMQPFVGQHPDHSPEKPCENAYFVPLIEQIVAAQGHFVIGTPGSSFSSFIHRMHDETFEKVYELVQQAKTE